MWLTALWGKAVDWMAREMVPTPAEPDPLPPVPPVRPSVQQAAQRLDTLERQARIDQLRRQRAAWLGTWEPPDVEGHMFEEPPR